MTDTLFNRKNIVINSSLLFIVASLLETILHEFGHLLAALVAGGHELVMFHNSVTFSMDGLTADNMIFIKAAGPNLSLLSGLIFHYICYNYSSRNMFFLFSLYMSVFGYVGCLGYLMVAPFFVYGDIGYIFYLLNIPVGLAILIAIVSAFILFLLMKSLTRYFVEMGTMEIVENSKNRGLFINALIVYPLIIGIIVTTLLILPAPTSLSLLAPICSPLTILWTYGYARHKQYAGANFNVNIHSIDKLDILWVVVFLLIVNMNRMLSGGFLVN